MKVGQWQWPLASLDIREWFDSKVHKFEQVCPNIFDAGQGYTFFDEHCHLLASENQKVSKRSLHYCIFDSNCWLLLAIWQSYNAYRVLNLSHGHIPAPWRDLWQSPTLIVFNNEYVGNELRPKPPSIANCSDLDGRGFPLNVPGHNSCSQRHLSSF